MATPTYTPNNWQAGQVLTAEKLNNTETGVVNATTAIQKLESPTVSVQTLEAGQQATASFSDGKWALGIPRGADGAQGPEGPEGDPGAKGGNGSSFRISKSALTEDQSGIGADALSPSNSVIPYAVGDLVLDSTTKTIYQIANVSDGSATIGKALATLP